MPKLSTINELRMVTRKQIEALKKQIKRLERELKRMEAAGS